MNAISPAVPQAAASVPVPVGEVFAIASEYVEAGRFDAAERMVAHVLSVHPRQPDCLHLKGLVAYKRNRLADAVVLMERSIAEGAGNKPVHWRNISEVYRLLGRLDDALAAARRAITLDPADPLGPFNLAMVLYDRQEVEPCVGAARHALDLRPNLPQAHMKMAQVLLLKGDLGPGWDHYEWRYQIPGAAALMPKTDKPHWDGRALKPGERLLLIGDQGFGDVLMFMRYIPWVMERAAEVSIACSPEMVSILRRVHPAPHLFQRWDETPPYVAYCPLSGLPRLHGTRLDNIPAPIPYLAAEPARVARWRTRLNQGIAPGLLRVGIGWAGRPTHNNDHNRSISLDMLAPIAAVPGIALVSLQKGPAAAQVKSYAGAAPLLNLDAEIETFEDTAAIVENLDLVVSVDTSIVHVAGAMGRPAWMMLPFAPDWRWLRQRTDTPWYPSVRLFRLPGPKQWAPLIADVAAELARHAAEHAAEPVLATV